MIKDKGINRMIETQVSWISFIENTIVEIYGSSKISDDDLNHVDSPEEDRTSYDCIACKSDLFGKSLYDIVSMMSDYTLKTISCYKIDYDRLKIYPNRRLLINNVYKILTGISYLNETIYLLNEEEWIFFKDNIGGKNDRVRAIDINRYSMLIQRGLLYRYLYADEEYVIIPDEIKRLYDNKLFLNTERQKNFMIGIEKYINAAVNLYGLISIGDCADIIIRYTGELYDKGTVLKMLQRMASNFREDKSRNYFFVMNMIAHKGYFSDDNGKKLFGRMENLKDAREDIPKYYPASQEDFLKYSHSYYIDDVEAIKLFCEIMSEYDLNNRKIKTVQKVLRFFMQEYLFTKTNELSALVKESLSRLRESFDDYSSEVLCQNFVYASQRVRVWKYWGHTYIELSGLRTYKPGAVMYPEHIEERYIGDNAYTVAVL